MGKLKNNGIIPAFLRYRRQIATKFIGLGYKTAYIRKYQVYSSQLP